MANDWRADVFKHIQLLNGLKLVLIRDLGYGKNFQFGTVRAIKRGTVGDFALHLACPWRLRDQAGCVITESGDRGRPGHDGAISGPELQHQRLLELTRGFDPTTQAHTNADDGLTVRDVFRDNSGALTIVFQNGVKLEVFPDASDGESWRLFKPGERTSHLVMGGGVLLDKPDESPIN